MIKKRMTRVAQTSPSDCWWCGEPLKEAGVRVEEPLSPFWRCKCGATTVPMVIKGPRNALGGLAGKMPSGYAVLRRGIYVSEWPLPQEESQEADG